MIENTELSTLPLWSYGFAALSYLLITVHLMRWRRHGGPDGAVAWIIVATAMTALWATGAFLAMGARKPLLFARTALRKTEGTSYDSPILDWSEENGLLVAVDDRQLLHYIERLRDDAAFRDETLDRQRLFFSRNVAEFDREKMSGIVQRMLAT